jgi:hypothetical protein
MGDCPSSEAICDRHRHLRTRAKPDSHRGGHWFDPSIAHQFRGRSRRASGVLWRSAPWDRRKHQAAAVVWNGEEHSQVVCPPGVDYLGGRPDGGRMGAIAATRCLRGPDHIAGTASTARATA